MAHEPGCESTVTYQKSDWRSESIYDYVEKKNVHFKRKYVLTICYGCGRILSEYRTEEIWRP